jgi:RNA polymerase-binding transcription factor DksA
MQKKLLEILLHKRAVLEGDVSSLREGAFKPSSLNISVDHMADFGTDNYDQEFNLGLVEATGFTLTEIDEAILRIQSGSFGICEGCGCAIPKARLEAIPYTRFCVSCQSEKESL